ncbi:MAG TPA: hypothetical protein VIS94_11350 [Desulfomonilia bacterium]
MRPHVIAAILMIVMLLMCSSCKEAPKVTHPIADKSDSSCLVCHQGGVKGTPATSHPKYKDCLRCHEYAGGKEPVKQQVQSNR